MKIKDYHNTWCQNQTTIRVRTIWRGRIIDCNGTQIKVNSLFVFFGSCIYVCGRQWHENATSDNGKWTKSNFISSGRHTHTRQCLLLLFYGDCDWAFAQIHWHARHTHRESIVVLFMFVCFFYWRNANPISLWYVWTTTRNRIPNLNQISTNVRSTEYGATKLLLIFKKFSLYFWIRKRAYFAFGFGALRAQSHYTERNTIININ